MFTATPTATVGIAIHLTAKILLLRKSTRRTVVRFLFSKGENPGAAVRSVPDRRTLVQTLRGVGVKVGRTCRSLFSARP